MGMMNAFNECYHFEYSVRPTKNVTYNSNKYINVSMVLFKFTYDVLLRASCIFSCIFNAIVYMLYILYSIPKRLPYRIAGFCTHTMSCILMCDANKY